MKKTACTLLALLCCITSRCFAWGPEGHRVIAEIARERLTAKARNAIVRLLGNDDLAAISTWADDIRRDRPETAAWHFVDIPWNATGLDEDRDCYHPSRQIPGRLADHHNCVVGRISILEEVLRNAGSSREDRVEALKFLVHFIGDLHQPLHAVAKGRGGNEVKVVQFGARECGSRPCDLHGTWDFGLIDHAHLSDREYIARLDEMIARDHLEKRSGGTPYEWANESFRLAHTVWLDDGAAVDESYYHRNRYILDERLALAGLRLAAVLNSTLGK